MLDNFGFKVAVKHRCWHRHVDWFNKSLLCNAENMIGQRRYLSTVSLSEYLFIVFGPLWDTRVYPKYRVHLRFQQDGRGAGIPVQKGVSAAKTGVVAGDGHGLLLWIDCFFNRLRRLFLKTDQLAFNTVRVNSHDTLIKSHRLAHQPKGSCPRMDTLEDDAVNCGGIRRGGRDDGLLQNRFIGQSQLFRCSRLVLGKIFDLGTKARRHNFLPLALRIDFKIHKKGL